MQIRRSRLAAFTCLMIAGASLSPGSSIAQETTKDTIIACMLENTTEQDVSAMRNMMVAALTDDNDGMKRYLLQVGFSVSNLAMNTCHMDYALLSKPEFLEISRLYGQKLGEKIMTEALAKLK